MILNKRFFCLTNYVLLSFTLSITLTCASSLPPLTEEECRDVAGPVKSDEVVVDRINEEINRFNYGDYESAIKQECPRIDKSDCGNGAGSFQKLKEINQKKYYPNYEIWFREMKFECENVERVEGEVPHAGRLQRFVAYEVPIYMKYTVVKKR